MPKARGLSGPTTVKSICFSPANPSKPGRSSADTGAHCASPLPCFNSSSAMPAFPGAQTSFLTRGDCASFQTRACSRPPDPMTRTFMAAIQAGPPPQVQKKSQGARAFRLAGSLRSPPETSPLLLGVTCSHKRCICTHHSLGCVFAEGGFRLKDTARNGVSPPPCFVQEPLWISPKAPFGGSSFRVLPYSPIPRFRTGPSRARGQQSTPHLLDTSGHPAHQIQADGVQFIPLLHKTGQV